MCGLILAVIDVPPGTKFECKEGPASGLSITVNTKEQCVKQRPPASCKVTVGQLITCYKEAKKDACGALGEEGVCRFLFDPKNGCSN